MEAYGATRHTIGGSISTGMAAHRPLIQAINPNTSGCSKLHTHRVTGSEVTNT